MRSLSAVARARWRAGAGRRALIPLAVHVVPGLTALVGVAVVVAALLPVAFTLAIGRAVGAVSARLQQAPGPSVGLAVGVVGGLFVATQLGGPVVSAIAGPVGLRINVRLRRRVMDAALGPVGVAHLEDPALLDLVSQSRGIGPGQFQPEGAFVGLAHIVVRRLQVLGSAILVARFSLPLALLAVFGGYVILVRLRTELIRDVTMMKDSTELLRRSDYARDLLLAPAATKEVRVFGLAGWVVERFVGEWRRAMAEVWRRRRQGNGWSALAMVVGGVCTAVGYGVVARAAARGEVGVGEMTVLLQAVGGAASFSINNSDLDLEWGAAAIPSVLALEREVAGMVDAEPVGERRVPADAPTEAVRFESVAFRYPGREVDVYSDLDLELISGQSLAVVGVNGAGKTTLVKLLAGLRRPTAGRITVDGVDLAELDARQWQRRVAAIFQDFARYELSADDNVAFGGVERSHDREAVMRAAERAGALPLIDDLPGGWDTVLSRRFTGGADLSGGQWQRLALARALFAVEAGATVLILDEPTANLDVRAEAELFDRFLQLTAGVTTVLVSHRFSTVRRADRICVLDGGRVVELGTHQELLELDGRYADMFSLQASRFAEEVGGVSSEDPQESLRHRLRPVVLVFTTALKADPVRAVVATVSTLSSQLWGLVVALGFRAITDHVVAGQVTAATRAAVVLGLGTIVMIALAWTGVKLRFTLEEKTLLVFDIKLSEALGSAVTIEHHERPDLLDEVELLRRSRGPLSQALGSTVYAGATVIQLVITGVLLAEISPWLLLLPISAIPSLWAAQRGQSMLIRHQERSAEPARAADHLFQVATSGPAAGELRLFGVGPELRRRFDVLWSSMVADRDRTDRRRLAVGLVGQGSFGVGFTLALALSAERVASGQASIGDLVLALSLAADVNEHVMQSIGFVTWMQQSMKTVGRYLKILDHAVGTLPPAHGVLVAAPERLIEGIRLDGVSFRYPGTDRTVLEDVDLFLPAGTTVAIVGDNGAGKSTLVKLVCRFYEPTSGQILIDDVPLSTIDPGEWRARLLAGFQDFAKLELIAREAVGVGSLAHIDMEPAVLGALDRASAGEVVEALPDGLTSQLGRTFEGGVELSGGQWQKLALGRAMMRETPLVLVLDEPTAALDPQTEHALFERYAGAARTTAMASGGITILVSHRFSTVRMADLIVVVGDCGIVEVGDHATLMAAAGTYADLYDLQARAYR